MSTLYNFSYIYKTKNYDLLLFLVIIDENI